MMMMMIDVTHCDIINYMDQDPDTLPNNYKHNLTKKKWVVLLAAESPEVK